MLAGGVAVAIDEVGSAAIWWTDEDGFAFVALNGGIEFGSHFGAESKLFWGEIGHCQGGDGSRLAPPCRGSKAGRD